MADNISKVREELRDDINVLEQDMLGEVKQARADTMQYVQSEIAQQNREIERVEDLIKQLTEDGGHSATTEAIEEVSPASSHTTASNYNADSEFSDSVAH